VTDSEADALIDEMICKRCGVFAFAHNGLRGSAAWHAMVAAGCACPHCTHEPCGRDDCVFKQDADVAIDNAEPR
jgi:hypothetical protein